MSNKKEESKNPTEMGSKKEKLLGKKKRISLWKIVLIAAVAATLPLYWFAFRDNGPMEASQVLASQVMEKVNYQNQSISMTKVEAVTEKGQVKVPLNDVKAKKLVFFEYQRGAERLPLLAYITPSGKVITAVSVCEPCNSTRFHIEGNQMVCNACFTRWDLETLKGISGGCLKYPPDAMNHKIQDGSVCIGEKELQSWKPRVFRG